MGIVSRDYGKLRDDDLAELIVKRKDGNAKKEFRRRYDEEVERIIFWTIAKAEQCKLEDAREKYWIQLIEGAKQDGKPGFWQALWERKLSKIDQKGRKRKRKHGSLKNWLYTVCRRFAIDFLRSPEYRHEEKLYPIEIFNRQERDEEAIPWEEVFAPERWGKIFPPIKGDLPPDQILIEKEKRKKLRSFLKKVDDVLNLLPAAQRLSLKLRVHWEKGEMKGEWKFRRYENIVRRIGELLKKKVTEDNVTNWIYRGKAYMAEKLEKDYKNWEEYLRNQ